MQPRITYGYCPNSGNNTLLTIGDLDIYFSYSTPIAFYYKSEGLVIRENNWRQTTGKHLNAINSDKKIRISSEKFEEKFQDVLKKMGLSKSEVSI